MKKIIILSLLLLQSFAMKLYAQSWSNWVILSNNKGISASVAFLIRNGKNGGISYWKTSNSTYVQGGSLFFSFDYIDDKGKPYTETGGTMIDLSKTGVVKDAGYWFVCNGGSITNIRVTRIDLPSDKTAGSGSYSSSGNNSSGDNNSGSPYSSNTGDNHASQNTGSSVTGTSSNNSNSVYSSNTNSSNAQSYNNRPLNFGTPQVNNNNSYNNSNYNAAVNNYNTAMTRLNNQLQTSQTIYNAFTGALQQLQQLHDEKAQQEQQEEQEREEEQQQQQQAQLEEQQREKAQRQAAAAAAAQAEMNRQWNIDQQTIGNYIVSRKTSEIPSDIKQVYYITYERRYRTGVIIVHTYTLNRYSDGTWMFQNDLQDKIKFNPYFNSSGVSRLLGFFGSKAKAQAALNRIKSNAPNAHIDDSFLALNGAAQAAASNDDFWNQ